MFSLQSTPALLNSWYSEALTLLTRRDSSSSAPLRQELARCHVPPQFVRLNTDVAIQADASIVGIIARTYDGKVINMWAVPFQSNNPELAEAFSILQGLVKAQEEGWTHIWCESDARNIILNLNANDGSDLHWMAEGVFSDILQLKSCFNEVIL